MNKPPPALGRFIFIYTAITFAGMYSLKKSLGQHFLTDENICRKIISALKEKPVFELLEIGPGGGALTKYLLQEKDIHLKAIEIDREKIEYLVKHFPDLEGNIIHQDILKADPPFTDKFSVVGNFPYNISTQILFKLLEWKQQIIQVIGMFQKEVAERIAAGKGNKVYGVTSVLVQAFFSVEYLFEVHERCFTPSPKVKSAVVRMLPLGIPVSMADEASFTLLVKTAFNQRRKTLRNATGILFEPDVLKDAIFDKRAEQLTVEDFGLLSFKMNKR